NMTKTRYDPVRPECMPSKLPTCTRSKEDNAIYHPARSPVEAPATGGGCRRTPADPAGSFQCPPGGRWKYAVVDRYGSGGGTDRPDHPGRTCRSGRDHSAGAQADGHLQVVAG